MTLNIEEQLLIWSADEIRELERRSGDELRMDPLLREAAELCVQSQTALATSLAAEHPRTLTSVILARQKRRWRWRLLLWGMFVPLAIIVLALFGSTVAALLTSFLWRP
jgi:uncharacterized membrane protein YfcA